MKIPIHPLTENPTAAWQELSKHQRVIKVANENPTVEVPSNMLRVVCMSDTHSATHKIKFDIPQGDVFIHAGDFTKTGRLQEVIDFNNWLGTLPHKNKVVIAGNHELSFDPAHLSNGSMKIHNVKEKLTNCIYLEDSEIIISGIKVYGTPWQPEFYNWAFNLPRGEACLSKWDMIPADTDILVTHSPPIGHGDLCHSGLRAGCVELLSTVQNRVKPKYHVFGHIHEGYGVSSDGEIIFINASTCNLKYSPRNPPVVFDITLPADVEKT